MQWLVPHSCVMCGRQHACSKVCVFVVAGLRPPNGRDRKHAPRQKERKRRKSPPSKEARTRRPKEGERNEKILRALNKMRTKKRREAGTVSTRAATDAMGKCCHMNRSKVFWNDCMVLRRTANTYPFVPLSSVSTGPPHVTRLKFLFPSGSV